MLKGGKEAAFNFEAEKHKDLQGNVTGYYLAGEACFGERWRELSEERQNAAVDLILDETDSEKAIRTLVTDYGLSPEQAEKALNAALDEYRASVSLRAAHKILPHLQAGCRYGEAREKAGYPAPGSFREAWRELPYYGEALPEAASRGTYAPEDRAAPEIFYGRTPNPTLHVALNQIRKLVNAIIALYGPPAEAIVHLAPELKVGRRQAAWQQKTEQASRERTNSALLLLGLTPTPETRLQYRLWQDQAPVTNSWHERIVRDYLGCVAPCRVYGESDHLIALLRHKWGVDALIRDAMRGKLKALLPSKGGRHDLLDWILDEENTEAPLHFHQAVDAAVVGSVTPGLFQTVARECARMFADPRFRENPPGPAEALPLPFPGYREQIGDRLESMVVSYKPDHGNARKAIHSPHPYTVAQLHQLMAYGLAAPRPDKPTALYVTRWPIADFIRLADIEAVADPGLRQKMLAAVEGLKEGSTQFKKALAAFAQTHGVRRLRVHVPRSPETMIPVYQRHEKGTEDAQPYKYYPRGSNYCAEVYCLNKGSDAGEWGMEIISNYHAHQKDFIPQWRRDHPTASLQMRLHIDDMVAWKQDGVTRICRVKKFAPDLVYFLDHRLARDEDQKLSRKLSPRQMQKFELRKISVDILGRVRDPLRAISYQRAA